MSTNPRIRVREAIPADADAIVDINFAAFDNNVLNHLMYPGGPSEDARKKSAARFSQQLTDIANGSPAKGAEIFIAVAEHLPEGAPSDGPGEVVAFAKWQLHRVPRTEEEWNVDDFVATTETWGEGVDVDVVNTFIGGINRKQRDHAKGEAALYLGLLACNPARQRLGAGGALLTWGLDLADRLGLPSRLEASPVGYPLYRKFGYEDVDVFDLKVTELWGRANTDGSNWGANNALALAGPVSEGVVRSVIMRRPPKA